MGCTSSRASNVETNHNNSSSNNNSNNGNNVSNTSSRLRPSQRIVDRTPLPPRAMTSAERMMRNDRLLERMYLGENRRGIVELLRSETGRRRERRLSRFGLNSEQGRRRGSSRGNSPYPMRSGDSSRGNSPHPILGSDLSDLESPGSRTDLLGSESREWVRVSSRERERIDLLNLDGGRSANESREWERVLQRGGNNDLDQLRSDLEQFERLFQTLLRQQLQVNDQHGDWNVHSTSQTCPPASRSAIERLPMMKTSIQDFDDEPKKECCICFLDFDVDDEVCRLPCGHIFHKECVSQWLRKKCTCPQCRWELETEDELFEVERLERMKSRKMRVKDHELDRLCIEALQDIASCPNVTNRAKLIETIRSLDNVDVVTTNNSDFNLKSQMGI